jgi:hypothetical protein
MGDLVIAVGDDFVLADAGAAARAPGHYIRTLVEPAIFVALLEELPDHVVVFITKGEIGAADFRQTEHAHHLLGGAGDRPLRPLDRHFLLRIFFQLRAQHFQRVQIVPIHPVAEPDRLLGLHAGIFEHAHLAQLDKFGETELLNVPFILETEFFFDVNLNPEPWQSKPFCQRWFLPSIAW